MGHGQWAVRWGGGGTPDDVPGAQPRAAHAVCGDATQICAHQCTPGAYGIILFWGTRGLTRPGGRVYPHRHGIHTFCFWDTHRIHTLEPWDTHVIHANHEKWGWGA